MADDMVGRENEKEPDGDRGSGRRQESERQTEGKEDEASETGFLT